MTAPGRSLRLAIGSGLVMIVALATVTVPVAMGSAGAATNLSVVAVFDAQAGVLQAHLGFPEDLGRQVGHLLTVLRALGHPGHRRGERASRRCRQLLPQADMAKLVKAGLVSSSWDQNKTLGMVTNSVVAFVVRKGNPKHITNWSDLVKSGVQVITPNPFSSGSAQWNLLAAYGAQLKQGKSSTQAKEYLKQLLHNTVAQPASASAALQTFLGGEGDVLLDYEDDALYAQRSGEPVSVVIPPQDILIQNPIAVVKTSSNQSAAKAFVSFLVSSSGQKIWGQQGYRPVLPRWLASSPFPQPSSLFTIAYLGGWTSARKKSSIPRPASWPRSSRSRACRRPPAERTRRDPRRHGAGASEAWAFARPGGRPRGWAPRAGVADPGDGGHAGERGRSGPGRDLPQPVGPVAGGRLDRPVGLRGALGLLARGDPARGCGGAKAHLDLLDHRGRGQRGGRGRHRLGPGPRRFLG